MTRLVPRQLWQLPGVSAGPDGRPIVPIRLYGGIGDRLFASAAMREVGLRAAYPIFDVLSDHYTELHDNLPWIAAVHRMPTQQLPNVVCPFEGHSLDIGKQPEAYHVFETLFVQDTPFAERRMAFKLSEHELAASRRECDRMFPAKHRPVVGIQKSGGMPIKQTARFELIVSELSKHYEVLVFESQGIAYKPGMMIDGVSILETRMYGALLAQLDGFVGFDSGPSYLAIALDVPTVILTGPVSATGIIGSLQGHSWWAELRENWIDKCAGAHGASCRISQEFPNAPAYGNGEFCPFRHDRPGSQSYGADCIDNIFEHRVVDGLKMVMEAKANAISA